MITQAYDIAILDPLDYNAVIKAPCARCSRLPTCACVAGTPRPDGIRQRDVADSRRLPPRATGIPSRARRPGEAPASYRFQLGNKTTFFEEELKWILRISMTR